MQYEVSTVIRRPVDEVFEFVTDVDNQKKWQASTIENTQTSPGPMQVGATIRHRGKWLGRQFESYGEVIEYEPDRAWGYGSISGPYKAEFHYRFEPAGGGTRLTMLVSAEDVAFFRLAEPLLFVLAKRMLQGDLNRLKKVIESGDGREQTRYEYGWRGLRKG